MVRASSCHTSKPLTDKNTYSDMNPREMSSSPNHVTHGSDNGLCDTWKNWYHVDSEESADEDEGELEASVSESDDAEEPVEEYYEPETGLHIEDIMLEEFEKELNEFGESIAFISRFLVH